MIWNDIIIILNYKKSIVIQISNEIHIGYTIS